MYVTHSSSSGLESDAETPEAAGDPMAKLMGDWSWRPEMQPIDPGYVYDMYERLAFGHLGHDMPPVRPWMVKAYDGRDLVMKPVRIGPRI